MTSPDFTLPLLPPPRHAYREPLPEYVAPTRTAPLHARERAHFSERPRWRGTPRAGLLAATALYRPTPYLPKLPPLCHAYRAPFPEFVLPHGGSPPKMREGKSISERAQAIKDPSDGIADRDSVALKLDRVARRAPANTHPVHGVGQRPS
jgi:hypothetical protein